MVDNDDDDGYKGLLGVKGKGVWCGHECSISLRVSAGRDVIMGGGTEEGGGRRREGALVLLLA